MLNFDRIKIFVSPSFFKSVLFYPDESQVLTCGGDRNVCFVNKKITYWGATDGAMIRQLEIKTSSINGIDINKNGKYFVIGGSDNLIKVYRYEEGDLMFEGVLHSKEITKVKFSPDNKFIVSTSIDTSIIIWKFKG